MQSKKTAEELVKTEVTKALDVLKNSLLDVNTPVLEYLFGLLTRIGHNFSCTDLRCTIYEEVPGLSAFPTIMHAMYDLSMLLLGQHIAIKNAVKADLVIIAEAPGEVMDAEVTLSHRMLWAELDVLQAREVNQVTQSSTEQDNATIQQSTQGIIPEEQGMQGQHTNAITNLEQGMDNLNINNQYGV